MNFLDLEITYERHWGLIRANEEAGKNNFFYLAKCDECNATEPCLDYVEIDNTKLIKSIDVEYDGEVYTHVFDAPVSATDVNEFRCKVIEALEEGYYQEFNIQLPIQVDGDTTHLYHVGRLTITGVTYEDDTTTEGVRWCDIAEVCKYQTFVPTGDVELVIDGEVTPVSITDETSLIAALEAAGFTNVEVDGSYVSFYGGGGISGTLDGKKISCCNCFKTFVEPSDEESEDDKRLAIETKEIEKLSKSLKADKAKLENEKKALAAEKKAFQASKKSN